jgi:hypothetical protein
MYEFVIHPMATLEEVLGMRRVDLKKDLAACQPS